MFNSLRVQLFFSHLFVVIASVFVIGAALLVFLRSTPGLERLDTERLTQIIRTLSQRDRPPVTQSIDELSRYAQRVAAEHDVRVAFINRSGQIIVDSEVLASRVEPGNLGPVPIGGPGLERGTLREGRRQLWAYVVAPDEPAAKVRAVLLVPRTGPIQFMVENFFSPLVQSIGVGIGLSILMSLLITYSVTRSLRKFSGAARAVAEGKLDQTVPVSGPTEVESLALSFNDMLAQVKASQQAQRDFVANVSHELKTPLTSIQGFSQAILDGATSEPAHAARIINDEAGRMRRLVDGLLDLARLDAGQSALQRAPTDLAAILESVTEKLSWRAREKEVTLHSDIQPLPTIVADGDRLAQVFTNLLDNALKYTPGGGTVTLSAQPDPSRGIVTLVVTDTGVGIPPEDLSRIFERFYRIDKSRAAGQGYGIGLAITKEIVQAHGGNIKAESRIGRGTQFTVQLPIIRSGDSTVTRRRP